jgi:SAM-dependent methyltransferase
MAGQAFFDRIPATSNDEAEKCQALYDEWAETYDQDLTHASHGYVGPMEAAKVIAQNSTRSGQVVLDAGCGSGLSGLAVRAAVGSDTIIDGIDISTGMLEVAAKKGVYRKLDPADLSKPIAIPDDSYDVVVCVGTLVSSLIAKRLTRTTGSFHAPASNILILDREWHFDLYSLCLRHMLTHLPIAFRLEDTLDPYLL